MRLSHLGFALLSTSVLASCIATDGGEEVASTDLVATAPAALVLDSSGPECTEAICGPNGPSMTNGVVDEIDFSRATQPGGYRFVSWRKGSDQITPVLGTRGIFGKIGSSGVSRYGSALVDSIIRLSKSGILLELRFDSAESPPVKVGRNVVAYRMSYRSYWHGRRGGWSSWTQLCDRFERKSDPNNTAALVIFGTRERFRPPVVATTRRNSSGLPIAVPPQRARVVASDPSSGIATLGCPVTVPGKMLGLGMTLTTMQRRDGYEVDLDYANAVLHAYRLAPEGTKSYTPAERLIFIDFLGLLTDNSNDELRGYTEGYWDKDGAICFDHLRVRPDETGIDLYRETGTPGCDEISKATRDRALVKTFLPFGTFNPDGLAYPPEGADDGPIIRDPIFPLPL